MSRLRVLLLLVPALGCSDEAELSAPTIPEGPHFTMGQGTMATLLGRGNFGDASAETFKVKRITGDWHVELKAKPTVDIAVQTIEFEPGGHSGWHRHPGPVFIKVLTGTMHFYEADDPSCTATVRTGADKEGYLDVGDGHIARNESDAPAVNLVIYLAPKDSALRKDLSPAPGNCPF